MNPNAFTHRPTRIDIDLAALIHNFRVIKNHVGSCKVMAIVKANAYGHGIIECSKELEYAGVDALGVAYLEEGLHLRQSGIKAPILVLGGVLQKQVDEHLKHDLEITASSVDKLIAIDERAAVLGKRARIHLKFDTGMERLGQHYYSADKLLEAAIKTKSLDIVGIWSHFATAENQDKSFAKLQLERFLEIISFFEKRSLPVPMRHFSCSGTIMQLPEANLDMIRPGRILYGIPPAAHLQSQLDLKPVLTLSTTVVYFKVVKKGAGVSYGHTWHAPRDTRIVTLPIGYGDGYPTRLSNQGVVLIRGKRYPVVGKVCMDQMMVDLGPDGTAYNGDEVILIGSQGEESIGVLELVTRMNSESTPELTVGLNTRVPRHYKNSSI